MVKAGVCFAGGHREIYKQDLRKLDIKFCNFVRMIAGLPGGLDCFEPRHDIPHEWNARVLECAEQADVKFITKPLDHPTYVEVSQDLVHVLHEGSSHKYLGRHTFGNLSQRGRVELHHRKTITWAKFNKHRTIHLQANT